MARTKTTTSKANGIPAPTLEVLTLDTAAALLQVSADGLRTDAESGRIPGRLVGGEWRFSRAGLLAWLAAPATPATNARQLSAIGSMKDDDTLAPLVDEIYRRRAKEG